MRKQARQASEMNRVNYNNSVSVSHNEQAAEHQRLKEANEMRIKQLEEIEQRMVGDL